MVDGSNGITKVRKKMVWDKLSEALKGGTYGSRAHDQK